MPLDSGDIIGIVYVWIGNLVHPEDALLAQEIANDMYNVNEHTFVVDRSMIKRNSLRLGFLHNSSDQRRK